MTDGCYGRSESHCRRDYVGSIGTSSGALVRRISLEDCGRGVGTGNGH